MKRKVMKEFVKRANSMGITNPFDVIDLYKMSMDSSDSMTEEETDALAEAAAAGVNISGVASPVDGPVKADLPEDDDEGIDIEEIIDVLQGSQGESVLEDLVDTPEEESMLEEVIDKEAMVAGFINKLASQGITDEETITRLWKMAEDDEIKDFADKVEDEEDIEDSDEMEDGEIDGNNMRLDFSEDEGNIDPEELQSKQAEIEGFIGYCKSQGLDNNAIENLLGI